MCQVATLHGSFAEAEHNVLRDVTEGKVTGGLELADRVEDVAVVDVGERFVVGEIACNVAECRHSNFAVANFRREGGDHWCKLRVRH